jgi:hypothetical protein
MLRRNMTLLNVDLRNNPGYDDNIKFRLVIKMSKNIRHLYNQFKKNIYTPEEYEKLKKFIDPTFFNSDIPEDIIKQFNAQNEEIIKDFTFSNNANNNTNNNINNKYNLKQILVTENNKNKKKTENNNIVVNNINVNKNKRAQSSDKSYKRESNLDKLSEKNNNNKNKNKYNNNFLGNNGYSKYNKYISLSIDNKKRNNLHKNNGNNNIVKLVNENLMLKKKIIEFKAKEIQNKLGKNIFIPDKYDNNSLNNNFDIADELLDKLNNVMYSMKKNGKNNNFKNINVNKEEKNDDNLNDKLGKFSNIDYIDIN